MDARTLDKYRLLRCIGTGGMAEVYEARRADDPTSDARVAVKVLLPQHVLEMEIVKSFIDEATIASGLSHPNVVGVLDWGCADEQYFIVMERVDGWDLHQLIEICSTLQRPLPVAAAAYVIHELARALDYIHTRPFEIVHRDVTPHNVFVDRAGGIKLSDFGVAKTAARWSQTHTGLIKGKLGYLAPEQVRGDPVSNRTDIYCAGLVLYELLTCQRYNRSISQSGLLTRAHDPVIILPSQSNPEAAPLDEVVRGALQHDPALRTRDAALLAEQTAAVLARHPFTAAELAGLVAALQREAQEGAQAQASAGQASAERTFPERLRPEPIEGVASSELRLEETERTLRSGPPDGFDEGLGWGLAPEAMSGAPRHHELSLVQTMRTTADEEPTAADEEPTAADEEPFAADEEPFAAADEPSAEDEEPTAADGDSTAAAEEPDKPADEPGARPRTVTPAPGVAGGAAAPRSEPESESGLISLLRAPSDLPLKATPTRSDDLLVPPAARRAGRGWLVAVAVALAAAGLLALVLVSFGVC